MTQRRRSRLAIWLTTYCRPQGHWPKLAARYPTGHAVAPICRRGTTPFWWMAAVRRQRPRQCTTWRRWPMYAKWPVMPRRRRERPSQPTPRWAIGSLVALTHCRGTIPPWHAAVRRPKPRTRTTRGQLQWPMQTSFRDVDTSATPCLFFHHSNLASTRTNRSRQIGLQKSPSRDAGFGKNCGQTDPQAPTGLPSHHGLQPRKTRDAIIIAPSLLGPMPGATAIRVLRPEDLRTWPRGIMRAGSYSSAPVLSTSKTPDRPVDVRPRGTPQRINGRGRQNMCFSIPRCAMILLPISSIEVWVVLSEGMF